MAKEDVNRFFQTVTAGVLGATCGLVAVILCSILAIYLVEKTAQLLKVKPMTAVEAANSKVPVDVLALVGMAILGIGGAVWGWYDVSSTYRADGWFPAIGVILADFLFLLKLDFAVMMSFMLLNIRQFSSMKQQRKIIGKRKTA